MGKQLGRNILAGALGFLLGVASVDVIRGQNLMGPAIGARVPSLNEAVVFTIDDSTLNPAAVKLARDAGSECLIRGWFKWDGNQPWDASIPPQVHDFGALFGGGITCSVIFEGEDHLSHAQVADMATRDPEGKLVRWPPGAQANVPMAYHGTLSNRSYLDYLLGTVRAQMDAGVDTVFMDEWDGALEPNEGYDDYSIADFRRFLAQECLMTKSWTATDSRWISQADVDLKNSSVCPGGTMASFDYRAYLRVHDWIHDPVNKKNPLANAWLNFRKWRDGRAWAYLVKGVRAYGQKTKRAVAICANGFVPDADFQVTNNWKEDDQMAAARDVDLANDEIPRWRGLVSNGRHLTRKRLPVVVFHDWGKDLPWARLSPERQNLWMRVRGAEIYASGGFLAFSLISPYMRDASQNGTLPTIVQQSRFYKTNRDLYLHGRYLGSSHVASGVPRLSFALWSSGQDSTVLVHVINRNRRGDGPEPEEKVKFDLPLSQTPAMCDAISPDWEGSVPVSCSKSGQGLEVCLTRLNAYAVVRLHFPKPIDVTQLSDGDADPGNG